MEFPRQVVSRVPLMREVYQTDYMDDTRTLDVHICWLRCKVEDAPACPLRSALARLKTLLRTVGGLP